MKDYSGRQPNQEQLENVVCKSDPKPGFSFILDNFAELLDDTFLQNLTSTICQGKHTVTEALVHTRESLSPDSLSAFVFRRQEVPRLQMPQ